MSDRAGFPGASGTANVHRDVDVAMRDGVTLATDIYLPDGEGPFPTLVFRVRGSRNAAFITGVLIVNPLSAVRRGYAVVIQEVRGRGGSAAQWEPWRHELNDGEDCLDWILAQPWCDGRLGAYGTAYSASGAQALALLGREELRAIAVLGTGADPHDGWVYTSGAFELGWNIYWCYMTAAESIARLDTDDATRSRLKRDHHHAIIEARSMASRSPLRDQPLLDEVGETQFREWLDHPDYDDYWRGIDVLAGAAAIRTPVLSIIGWYDNFLGSHMAMHRTLTSRAQEPARSHHRLVVGPWEHVNYVNAFTTSKTGDVEFGPEASCGAAVSEPLVLDWMDRWVKGEDRGPAGGVRYWQMGSDEWREGTEWPPPHTLERWVLGSAGHANTVAGDGTLAPQGAAESAPSSSSDMFRYDPADPVATVGGRLLMPTIELAGIRDQSVVEDRDDVLCYSSRVLAEDIEVAGPITVELWVTTDVEETDFTAKLVDVRPDGYCVNIADGIVRTRYRESTRSVTPPMEPGVATLLTIDLWDVAHTFCAGNCLRLEVSSSNFPRFDRNLNTGGLYRGVPFGSESLADARVATQTVLHDGQHVSALLLPVIR